MRHPLLDAGVAEPVHQPLAELVGLVYGSGEEGSGDNRWEIRKSPDAGCKGTLGLSREQAGAPDRVLCPRPPRTASLCAARMGLSGRTNTFMEGVRGEVGDLGHDWEQVPGTGPLGLPALEDPEDTLAHAPDLPLRVTLQTEHRWTEKQ